jgi:transcriptional regulator with XRE-family HTH domain
MDVNFIRDRISQLRTNQGISEYKMSLDLGHSKSYVQSISSGKALPSMSEFLYICEYLGVTPKEFFDGDVADPQMIQQLVNHALLLSPDDLLLLVDLAKRLEAKK